jgi:hypothetical protein
MDPFTEVRVKRCLRLASDLPILSGYGLKFAVRSLRKSPGFYGAGHDRDGFRHRGEYCRLRVVSAVLLRPLAFREPNRVVTLTSLWKKSGGHGLVSAPDYHDWHDQSTAFSAMAY